jgi:enamine deaminase RidA (YjgF/YER057c/UK114 family)
MELKRTNYSSGAPLEEKVGYSRMVKVGPFISIGGTTSVLPDGSVYGEGSVYEQTKYILNKFIGLLGQAGASEKDVTKIKGYLTDMAYASEAGRAYAEIFKEIRPLLTFVGTPMLNRPAQLVELELEAIAATA